MMKWKVLTLIMMLFTTLGIAQNHNLKLLGRWDNDDLPVDDFEAYNDIWAWHDGKGKEYAIMGSLDSVYFIDVSNPTKPIVSDVESGKWKNCIHRDFKTYGQYCYAVADEGYSSLQIFDMSYLPDSVHKVYDSDTFMVRSHNVFIDGKRLYLATCTSKSDFIPLRVLSIEDPTKPTFLYDLRGPVVGGKPLFREVHDLFARNDTVYCSGGDNGLFVYTYADSLEKSNSDSTWKVAKPNMTLVSSLTRYSNQGYNHSSWLSVDGKHMVMQDETAGTKLKMFYLEPGDIPEEISTFGSNSSKGSVPHNAFTYKKKVFVSYYHEGVLVYDISNPEAPEEFARYDTYPQNTDYEGLYGCWGVYPFLPSGNILASDQLNGLHIFSLATSIDDGYAQQQFKMYPNPVVNQLTVELTDDVEDWTVEVFDISGRNVLQQNTSGSAVQIDVMGLESGLYVVRLKSSDFEHSGRIILR